LPHTVSAFGLTPTQKHVRLLSAMGIFRDGFDLFIHCGTDCDLDARVETAVQPLEEVQQAAAAHRSAIGWASWSCSVRRHLT
jgi:hypothetical protein